MPTEVDIPSVHETRDPEAVARAEAIRAETESKHPSAALKLLEKSLERQQQSLFAERAQLDADRKAFRDECAKERERIAEERTKAIAALEGTNKAVISAQEQLETTTRLALRATKDMEEFRPKESLGKVALELVIEKGAQLFSEAMEHGARRQLPAGDVGNKLEDMKWSVVRQIVELNNQLAEVVQSHGGKEAGIAWLKEQLRQHGWSGEEKDGIDSITVGQAQKVIEGARAS